MFPRMAEYVSAGQKFFVEAASNDTSHSAVEAMVLFVALLCACIVIGHLLEGHRWANESIAALILGVFTGLTIYAFSGGTQSHILHFDEQLFFIYLLPPIIFNAGFQAKKKQLFHNLVAIMLFGIAGVFISCAVITSGAKYAFPKVGLGNLKIRDYLTIGAIFSATDTVCTLQVLHQDETPLLYSLVFGEGVVNDATCVVLFRAVQKFDVAEFDIHTGLKILLDFISLFSASTSLGVGTGLLSAYAMKKFYFGRHSTNREIAMMALLAYLSYTIAELCELSGILSVFFCGIVMSHYTWHNVTENSRITAKHAFATFSFIAETFIFLYVGMDVLDVEKWRLAKHSASWAISGIIMFLILLGRAAFVFAFSALSNFLRRTPSSRISFHHQVIIWWAGLMRGAVSIALAFQQFTSSREEPSLQAAQNADYATVICSTVSVVLFSTVVFGLLTKPLIHCLNPPLLPPSSSETTPSESPKEPNFDVDLHFPLLSRDTNGDGDGRSLRRSSLSLLLQDPTSTVHHLWRKFDDAYMRPVFGGQGYHPHVGSIGLVIED